MARDSAGDVVGVTYGRQRCGHPLEMQVQSILAALQLAEKLRNEGRHVGPVSIETHHGLARAMVLGLDTAGLEIDSCEIMSDDDEDVPAGQASRTSAEWSVTFTTKEEIAEKLPQYIRVVTEKDRLRAGNILVSV